MAWHDLARTRSVAKGASRRATNRNPKRKDAARSRRRNQAGRQINLSAPLGTAPIRILSVQNRDSGRLNLGHVRSKPSASAISRCCPYFDTKCPVVSGLPSRIFRRSEPFVRGGTSVGLAPDFPATCLLSGIPVVLCPNNKTRGGENEDASFARCRCRLGLRGFGTCQSRHHPGWRHGECPPSPPLDTEKGHLRQAVAGELQSQLQDVRKLLIARFKT